MKPTLAFLRSRRALAMMAGIAAFALLPGGAPQAQIKKAVSDFAEKLSKMAPGLRRDSEIAKENAEPGAPGSPVIADLPTENKEIGEMLTPRALLKESPALQKLLGDKPDFVYDPANRPDPMLIPWTRARVMYAELNTIAEQAIAQRNWQLAEMSYRHMLTNLKEPEYVAQAKAGLEKLSQIMAQAETVRMIGAGQPIEAKLPPWIAQNTKAVIIDKDQSMCLVGTFILKVGDLVPRQPVDVKIVKIEPAAVHYKVLDKIFIVNVQEGE